MRTEATDSGDPSALAAAITEAEGAGTDMKKRGEIIALREFILNYQGAFCDCRERLKGKGIDNASDGGVIISHEVSILSYFMEFNLPITEG